MLHKKNKTIRIIQECSENLELMSEHMERERARFFDVPEGSDKKVKKDALDKYDAAAKNPDVLLFEKILIKLNVYLKKHPHRVVNNDFLRNQIKDIATIIYQFLHVEGISLLSILAIKNLWPSQGVKEEKKYFPVFDHYQVGLAYEKENIEKAIQDIESVLARVDERSGKPDKTLRKLFAAIFNPTANKKIISNVFKRYETAFSLNAKSAAKFKKLKKKNQKTLLLSIPQELLLMVMFYLDFNDKINMGLTSSVLYTLSADEALWKQEVAKNNMVKYREKELFKSFFFQNMPCTFMVIHDSCIQRHEEYDALAFLNNDIARISGQARNAGHGCKLFNSLRSARDYSAELRGALPDSVPIYIVEFALPMHTVKARLNIDEEVYKQLKAVYPEKDSDHPVVKVEMEWAYRDMKRHWQISYAEKDAKETGLVERSRITLA